MRLLVSVRDVREAEDALAGGADVIDVKEPVHGALGAADARVIRAVARCVNGRKPVSIVLGDLTDVCSAVELTDAARRSGASMVKIGLGGVRNAAIARHLIRAVSARAVSVSTVVVAYGDAARARSLDAERILELASAAGARGLVLDTYDKSGPSLSAFVARTRLEQIIDHAHGAGLFVGVAGKLGRQDIDAMRDLGVDLFGVRGAVCTEGRTARLVRERVRVLARLVRHRGSAELAAQSA